MIAKKTKERTEEVEKKTLRLIDETRKGILINYWMDVFKYGLGTAVCVVPVYFMFKYVLGLLGVNLP